MFKSLMHLLSYLCYTKCGALIQITFNTGMFIVNVYFATYAMVKFEPYDDVRGHFWLTNLILTLMLAVELVLRILAWMQRYGDIWGLFISWEMMIDVMVFYFCSFSLALILLSSLKDQENQSIFFFFRGFREFNRVIRAICWFRIISAPLSQERLRLEKGSIPRQFVKLADHNWASLALHDFKEDRGHIMHTERSKSCPSIWESFGRWSDLLKSPEKTNKVISKVQLQNPSNTGNGKAITLMPNEQEQVYLEEASSASEFRTKRTCTHESSKTVEQKNSTEEERFSEIIVVY